jgi:quercetin dioxygenase-like cupin family protein
MKHTALDGLVAEELDAARRAPAARASRTVHGGRGHALRQTVITLLAGHSLDDHESPGEATLQVLRGHVRLTAGADAWVGVPGDLVTVPAARHRVDAIEDSAVLLTVVVTPRAPSS